MRTCAAKVQLPSECRISHSSQSTYFDAVALIASPGVLEFIGNLNPLKLIFDFITAWRQEGRNHFEVRERIRSEEFAKTIETWELLYERAEDLPKRKQDATRGELMAVLLKLIDQQTQRLELLRTDNASLSPEGPSSATASPP